jgi:hypothetical protein
MKYGEIFNKYFPVYLSFGMSSSEYWDEEPELAIAYREAHRIKLQHKNEELWLQGIYTSQALLSTVGNMFSSKGSKPLEYPKEPLPLTEKEAREREEAKQKARFEKMKEMMMMASKNSKKKEG